MMDRIPGGTTISWSGGFYEKAFAEYPCTEVMFTAGVFDDFMRLVRCKVGKSLSPALLYRDWSWGFLLYFGQATKAPRKRTHRTQTEPNEIKLEYCIFSGYADTIKRGKQSYFFRRLTYKVVPSNVLIRFDVNQHMIEPAAICSDCGNVPQYEPEQLCGNLHSAGAARRSVICSRQHFGNKKSDSLWFLDNEKNRENLRNTS